MLTLFDIDKLTGGGLGKFDVACPACGPHCRSGVNRRRQVLRIWRNDPEFASFFCARCENKGIAHDHREPVSPIKLAKARAVTQAAQQTEVERSLAKVRHLWSSRLPMQGSIAETYLRQCRGYGGPLPPTLGFLPARGDHPPAMIAAFGLAVETRPGELEIYDQTVRGVHLTKLNADGSGKAGTAADKLTIGIGNRLPIILAPINDGLGLVIAEGIEDALTAHEAMGLGAWAAGSAGRLPMMAESVPSYVEAVTVLVDGDDIGRVNAAKLADALVASGREVRTVQLTGAEA